MKLAIIGSGVSGLVSTYLLGREHDVTLFEADSRVGGHVNTVPVSTSAGELNIDTGFIVFNRPNYPGFVRLLEDLDVESQPSKMSFSVKDERHDVEYSGLSVGTLFAKRQNLTRRDHWRMLNDVRRFIAAVSELSGVESAITVGQSVKQLGLSEEFLDRFLSPLGCALWSCPHESFVDFPVQFVAEFLENHQLINLTGRPEWRTIRGGSRTYVDALLKRMNAIILLNHPVERIARGRSGISVFSQDQVFEFDEVIVATHANQSLTMLWDPTLVECELLRCFPYQRNEAILHTDISVLPANRKAWSSWNYRVPAHRQAAATVTYNMNILQSLETEETYCVSLNESDVIDPAKVIARFDYDHPVATVAGLRAKSRRNEMIRHNGISYCGAYWGSGFHEAGVQSALQVCQSFGVEL
jgi:uncharacterized protein